MSKNTESLYVYPNYDIDDRVFFNDVNISGTETLNKYIELIQNNRYTDANILLNDGIYDGDIYPEIDFFGAWIFNLLENRLFAIESYIENMEKPDLVTYTDNIPTDKSEGYCWISNIILEEEE